MKFMPELDNVKEEIRATVNAGLDKKPIDEIGEEIKGILQAAGLAEMKVEVDSCPENFPLEFEISTDDVSEIKKEYPGAKKRYASLLVTNDNRGIHLAWLQGVN